jgi:hypothetical protein
MAEQGIEFNVQTPGEHTSEAEQSVRSIKDVARAVANSLPYGLCSTLVVYLVYYATFSRNALCTKGFGYAVPPPPRVLFHGRRTNCATERQLAFGEFVHVHEDDTNPRHSMEARTLPALEFETTRPQLPG